MKYLSFIFIIFAFWINFAQSARVTIEPFDHDRDYGAVAAIITEYPSLSYELLGRPDGTTKRYITHERYRTDVIRVDDRTIGFINYIMCPPSRFKHISGNLFIHLLGIDPQYHRHGYGAQLVAHVCERMQEYGIARAAVTVKKDNFAARELYEKAGFVCLVAEEEDELLYEYTVVQNEATLANEQ